MIIGVVTNYYYCYWQTIVRIIVQLICTQPNYQGILNCITETGNCRNQVKGLDF